MKNTVILMLILSFCFFFTGCSREDVKDGTYSIEATLYGGSGRSQIEETTVKIEKGRAVARIVWNSPFYEYMLVDGERYEPVQESGNATFEIPIVFNETMKISASTVAMSRPYLIDYELYFDSKTLKGESL